MNKIVACLITGLLCSCQMPGASPAITLYCYYVQGDCDIKQDVKNYVTMPTQSVTANPQIPVSALPGLP